MPQFILVGGGFSAPSSTCNIYAYCGLFAASGGIGGMYKNVSGQKLIVFAFDSTTNAPKTGDAANITAYVDIDFGGVTVLTDTSATELSSSNAAGYYQFDLTQAETNGNTLFFSAKSSTSNIVVIGVPATVYTLPTTGILAPTTAGRTLDVTATGAAGIDWANIENQNTAVDLQQTNIGSIQATLAVNVTQWNGENVTQSADGIPTVSVLNYYNSDTDSYEYLMTPADVNAEVVDALSVDTYAEPGQGTPAATASITTKLGYIYKAWRNKKTQTATVYSLFADDATTVDQKASVSDNGTTTTLGEVATGP